MKVLQPVAFQYLKEAAAERRYYASTLRIHRSHLRALCAYTEKNLLRLNRADIQDWINFQIEEAGDSPKALSSVNHRFVGIRAFYKFMIQSGRIFTNPCDGVEVPRATIPDLVFLDEAECEQLLASPRRAHRAGDIDDHRLRLDSLILELIYGSGLRVSECIGIRKSDIAPDEDAAGLSVNVESRLHGKRSVPLTRTCETALEAYLQLRPESRDFNLLVSKRGFPLKPEYFQTIVYDYAQRAHLNPDISPHKLRHSFAKRLSDRGIDADSLRILLGNKSLKSVERYLESSPTTQQNALGSLFLPV